MNPRRAAASPGSTGGAATDDELTRIWEEAKKHLRGRIADAAFQFWFDRTVPLGLDDGAFVIGVPNDFAREWIEKRLVGQVAEALEQVLGGAVEVKIVVDARAAALPDRPAAEPTAEPPVETAPPKGKRGDRRRKPRTTRAVGDLNPRYVFDRFVTGPNNEYATAVARSVAESPASAYNPVFIYADTGLGKTHLTQALAHAALEQHPDLQVRYVTCERFTDDFINAVTDKGRIEGFKQTYRDNDVLIVDDVQFLAEKQQTQVEFFHTFNALYEAGKQIVITSDRPPRELEVLEERLRSRFGQGVVVDISRPDLETRIAILRKQVKWEGFEIAEPEALEWIAQKVTTNIREALRSPDASRQLRLHPWGRRHRRDHQGGAQGYRPQGLPASGHHRDGPERGGPAVRSARQRPARQPAHPGRRLRTPHRDVPLQGSSRRPRSRRSAPGSAAGTTAPSSTRSTRWSGNSRTATIRSCRTSWPSSAPASRPPTEISPQPLWTTPSSPADDPHGSVEIGYASLTIDAAAGRSATFCTHRPHHCAEAPALIVQRQDHLSTSSTGTVMTARSIYFSFFS